MNGRTRAHLCIILAAAIVVLVAPAVATARPAVTEVTVLHGFTGGTDGSGPDGTLIRATDGNFYGTTIAGGTAGFGTVFQMTAGGSVTVLHSFTGGSSDGASPRAGLIQATDGNFYGTTQEGGPVNEGTVFTMTPGGAITILHMFTGADGGNPSAALIQAADGNFYGTTSGIPQGGNGTIFKITPGGTLTTLHAFAGGTDGSNPLGALIQATDGNFYGTTTDLAGSGFGTVFQMTPGGALTTLHAFMSGTSDGAYPDAGLIQATDGNFYGTTAYGGASGNGTVFQMTPGGAVTVLHAFTGGTTDGANPEVALIQAKDGNFYGTTGSGGTSGGYGTVFQMTPSGTVTILHAFTGGTTDGANPFTALIETTSGNFYGTTFAGGASGNGVVFHLRIAVVEGDFEGDGRTDLAVFRPSNGTWYIWDPSTGTTTGVQWGNGSDIPVPGDYDGDGKTDIAVFRPSNGTWYIVYSSTGTTAGFQWGNGNDVPVPGDYNGNGKTDLAVFRPSDGTWYIWDPSTGTTTGFQWGNSLDIPVPGDYDGDGKTDVAVFRPSSGTWYIVYSGTGTAAGFQWGTNNDIPVPGDYDGDGKTDIAVFRPSNGTWYLMYSSTETTAGFQWGNGNDVPVPGDYDGDGKTDLVVFRPSNGTWYIWEPSTGTTAGFQWGNGTDVPVLKAP